MYQYILCLSKLPRAWADILLPRSGVLQPGLQYSKVTTGRVCACRKIGEGGCGGVMGRRMKLKEQSLCSHIYSTSLHRTRTQPRTVVPPNPHPATHTHTHARTAMLEYTHICHPHLSRPMCACGPTFARVRSPARAHARVRALACA